MNYHIDKRINRTRETNSIQKNKSNIIFYMKYWLINNKDEINSDRFKEYTNRELNTINFQTLEGEKALNLYAEKRFDDIIKILQKDNLVDHVLKLSKKDQALVFVTALKKGRIHFSDNLNDEFDLFGTNELITLEQYKKLKTDKIRLSPIISKLNKKFSDYTNTLLSTYAVLLKYSIKDEDYFLECVGKADEILNEYDLYSDAVELNAERIARMTILVYIKGEEKTRELIEKMELPENIQGNKFLFFKSKLRRSNDLFSKIFEDFDKRIMDDDLIDSYDSTGRIILPLTQETRIKMENNKKMKSSLLYLLDKIIEAEKNKTGIFTDPQTSYWIRLDMADWVVWFGEYTDMPLKEIESSLDELFDKISNLSNYSEVSRTTTYFFESMQARYKQKKEREEK